MSFDTGRRKIYHARLMYARPFIDSLDFARNGGRISGEVPVAALPRLLDMLKDSQGILSYAVRGDVDEQGAHYLELGVSGRLQLICQRCLNGLDYPVKLDTRLMLKDQAALDAIDDSVAGGKEEMFDSILANERLDVFEMLEEEILLSLPFAPKHEPAVCEVKAGSQAHQEKLNPFAVLQALKRN